MTGAQKTSCCRVPSHWRSKDVRSLPPGGAKLPTADRQRWGSVGQVRSACALRRQCSSARLRRCDGENTCASLSVQALDSGWRLSTTTVMQRANFVRSRTICAEGEPGHEFSTMRATGGRRSRGGVRVSKASAASRRTHIGRILEQWLRRSISMTRRSPRSRRACNRNLFRIGSSLATRRKPEPQMSSFRRRERLTVEVHRSRPSKGCGGLSIPGEHTGRRRLRHVRTICRRASAGSSGAGGRCRRSARHAGVVNRLRLALALRPKAGTRAGVSTSLREATGSPASSRALGNCARRHDDNSDTAHA